jgi:hypothetical protein
MIERSKLAAQRPSNERRDATFSRPLNSKKSCSSGAALWQIGASFLYNCDDAPEKVYVTAANLEGASDREPDRHVSF